jgi:hypothetical protein
MLPSKGSAFAFPTGDGRYSVCRILVDSTSDRARQWGTETILVACSAWIGPEIPRVENPELRPILHLNHHSWNNKPHVLWILERLPQDFTSIGTISPTVEEEEMPCQSFGRWSAMVIQPLDQWRWDNDRGSVLAEDKVEEQKTAEDRLTRYRERQKYLKEVTLKDLLGHHFFPNWNDFPSPGRVLASRQILTRTVEQLLELGRRAPRKKRMAILKECIESFNELDAEHSFIETVEREDICEEFEAIVHACGLGDQKDLADKWRDW